MGFFDGLRRLFGRPEKKDPIPASYYEIGFARAGGAMQRFQRANTAQWLAKYGESAYLRSPVSRLAHGVAQIPWRVYRVTKGETGLIRVAEPDHPLQKVWDDPVPYDGLMPGFSGYDWRLLGQMWLELVGDWFFAPKLGESGMPEQFIPIPPTWVKSTPSTKEPFFRVEIPGGDKPFELPSYALIWWRHINPADPYGRGLGVAGAVDDEIQQLEWMNKFNNQFFRNGAHPGQIIGIEGLDEDNEKRIREQWETKQSGFWNAWRTAFVGGKVTMVESSRTHKDLDFNESVRMKRDVCLQNWGTPPELVGIIENSNRATIQGADYVQSKNNILPALTSMQLNAARMLVPMFRDPGIVLEHENPVKETDEFKLDKVERGLTRGAITINEWRRELNIDPVPGGDVLLVPLNVAMVDPSTGKVLQIISGPKPGDSSGPMAAGQGVA